LLRGISFSGNSQIKQKDLAIDERLGSPLDRVAELRVAA